jgi:hypothetical protein
METYAGIDVAKDKLDVHVRPGGEAFCVTRDAKPYNRIDVHRAVWGRAAAMPSFTSAGSYPRWCSHRHARSRRAPLDDFAPACTRVCSVIMGLRVVLFPPLHFGSRTRRSARVKLRQCQLSGSRAARRRGLCRRSW